MKALSIMICLLLFSTQSIAMGDKKRSHDSYRVEVTESMRPCQTSADCDQVGIHCSGCCQYDAVAKTQALVFKEKYQSVCKGYEGGVCECHDSDRKQPECIDNRCVLK